MDETTITTRQNRVTDAGKYDFASPDLASGQAICTSYIVGAAFDGDAPEFLNFVLFAEEPTATLELDRTTANYGVYETPSGAITGLYISRDTLGISGDEDAPEEIPVALHTASEEEWDAESEDDEMNEEADALLA